MKNLISKSILAFCLLVSAYANAVELGVMVLYHRDFAVAKNPSTTIASYINSANGAYSASGMNLSLKLVHSQMIEGMSAAVGSFALRQLEEGISFIDTTIWDLQDKYRPDITVYIGYSTSELCGQAYFPYSSYKEDMKGRDVVNVYETYKSEFKAVATVAWQSGCGELTFTHEVGHVLGAGHGEVRQKWDWLGGLIGGTETWHPGIPIANSVGHGYYNDFITIMAYPDVYGTATRINRISNPVISFGSVPTGTDKRNAAAGMVKIATDKVQYNSACYPALRSTDYKYRTRARRCNMEQNCAKWETVTKIQDHRPVKVSVCVQYNPN